MTQVLCQFLFSAQKLNQGKVNRVVMKISKWWSLDMDPIPTPYTLTNFFCVPRGMVILMQMSQYPLVQRLWGTIDQNSPVYMSFTFVLIAGEAKEQNSLASPNHCPSAMPQHAPHLENAMDF
jgi:hypothetical protein